MRRAEKKRLNWLFLISYVALVYGMLSVTPIVTKPLERHHAFLFGIVADIAVVLALILLLVILKRRLKGKGPAACAGIAAVILIYASLLAFYTPIAVEKLHLLEYGFLSYLVLRVVKDVRPPDLRYLCVILAVALIGAGDELLQKAIPTRVYDPRDIAMNSLAGVLALALLILLDRA